MFIYIYLGWSADAQGTLTLASISFHGDTIFGLQEFDLLPSLFLSFVK